MFRQRLLTTLVLVPLILAIIYYAEPWVIAGLMGLLLAVCGFEWSSLIPIKSNGFKIGFIVLLLLVAWSSHFFLSIGLLLSLILWALILVAVLYFPKSQQLWGHSWVVFLIGLIVLPLFIQSILKIYQANRGKELIVYVFFLIWAADIGAYLSGKQWGKHKLIPLVSPGKTREGVLGGIVLSLLVAFGGYFFFQPNLAWNWFLIAMMSILISVLGDLFLSMLKRRCNLKDSGHLLPGHGGILDRVDSMIAALPLFYSGLIWFNPGV